MTISVALQHPARRTDCEVSVPNPNHKPVFSLVFFSFYDGGGGWEFRDEKLDAVSFLLKLPQDTGDWSDLDFDTERRTLHDKWCCEQTGSDGIWPMGRGPNKARLWNYPWGDLVSYIDIHNGAHLCVKYGAEDQVSRSH